MNTQAEYAEYLECKLTEKRIQLHALRAVLKPAIEAAGARRCERIHNGECGKRDNPVLKATKQQDQALLEAGRILGVSDED